MQSNWEEHKNKVKIFEYAEKSDFSLYFAKKANIEKKTTSKTLLQCTFTKYNILYGNVVDVVRASLLSIVCAVLCLSYSLFGFDVVCILFAHFSRLFISSVFIRFALVFHSLSIQFCCSAAIRACSHFFHSKSRMSHLTIFSRVLRLSMCEIDIEISLLCLYVVRLYSHGYKNSDKRRKCLRKLNMNLMVRGVYDGNKQHQQYKDFLPENDINAVWC